MFHRIERKLIQETIENETKSRDLKTWWYGEGRGQKVKSEREHVMPETIREIKQINTQTVPWISCESVVSDGVKDR